MPLASRPRPIFASPLIRNLLLGFGLTCLLAAGCATFPDGDPVPEFDRQDQAMAAFVAGQLASDRHEFEKAIALYRRALALDPTATSVRRSLVSDLLRAGRPQEAITEFKPIVSQKAKDAKTQYLLGQLYEAAGNTAAAERTYRQTLTLAGAGSEARTGLGLLLLRQDQEKEGRRFLAEALQINPRDREARQALVKLEIGDGRVALAEKLLRQGLVERPDDQEWLIYLARVLRLQEKNDEAYRLYLKVLDYDPYSVEAHQVLAEENLLRRQWHAAASHLEWLLKVDPTNPVLRRNLGLAYYESGEEELAKEQLAPLVEQQIADSLTHFLLGSYYQRKKLWRLAEQEFRAALDLDPNSAQAYLELAAVLIQSQDASNAAVVLDNLVNRLKLTAGRWARCGQLWLEIKNPKRALEAFDQALRQEPRKAVLYLSRGRAYNDLDKFEDAVTDWERAARLDPGLSEAYNYLGYLHAERGLKLDQAAAWVRKALHLEPDNGNYHDSMGWVWFQQRKYADAIKELELAISLLQKRGEEVDPVIYDHLGQACEKAGDFAAAEKAWKNALQLDPGNQDVQGRLRLLQARPGAAP